MCVQFYAQKKYMRRTSTTTMIVVTSGEYIRFIGSVPCLHRYYLYNYSKYVLFNKFQSCMIVEQKIVLLHNIVCTHNFLFIDFVNTEFTLTILFFPFITSLLRTVNNILYEYKYLLVILFIDNKN